MKNDNIKKKNTIKMYEIMKLCDVLTCSTTRTCHN